MPCTPELGTTSLSMKDLVNFRTVLPVGLGPDLNELPVTFSLTVTARPMPGGEGCDLIQKLSSLIWSVADLLRGDYKQSEYGKVILPFTVLRRLDCVLEPTKAAVLAE
jgi:hypothetical protein